MKTLQLLFILLPFSILSQVDCENPPPGSKGKCITTYDNGQTKIVGKIKNGKQHGSFTEYHPKGELKAEYKYANGLIQGNCVNYFPNGIIFSQYIMVDGLIQGKYIEYHKTGAVRVEGEMVDSKEVGVWSYYDEWDKLVNTIDYDKISEQEK